MSFSHKRVLLLLTFLLCPSVSFASSANMGFDGLNTLIQGFASGVAKSTGYLMLTLAVVAFFFGMVQFIWSSRQGAEGKEMIKGKQFMLWGIIGIFVMFSVWGIVKFAQNVFGIQGDNTITVPSLNFQQASGVAPAGTGNNLFSTGGSSATGITTSGITNQAQAQQLVNYCIKNGGNAITCQTAAQNAYDNNVAGSAIDTQAKAYQLVKTCIANGGNTAACQTAANNALNATKKGQGYSCVISDECETGLFCNDGVCSKTTTTNGTGKLPWGYSCKNTDECQTGLICDTNDNTCADDTKSSRARNNNSAASVTQPNGSFCQTGSDCQSGYCEPSSYTCATKDTNTNSFDNGTQVANSSGLQVDPTTGNVNYVCPDGNFCS